YFSASADRPVRRSFPTRRSSDLSAAAWLGQSYGVNGALGGFVLGQTIWLALFVEHIHREFPAEREVSFEFVAYFQKFWDLGLSGDRKSTRLNSSHVAISYAVFCL